MRTRWWLPALLSLAACSSDDDSVSDCTVPAPPAAVNCSTTGNRHP